MSRFDTNLPPSRIPVSNLHLPRRRVIIVEDDQCLANLYALVIEKYFSRAQILKYTNGDDVWQELSKADPDLLITDVQHPGTDAWEMLKLLAAAKVTYPILMISGEIQPEVEYKNIHPGLKLTMMSKPFYLKNFLKYLTDVFESNGEFTVPVIQTRPNDSTRARLA